MPQLLKNKNLEILIDLPDEQYNFSRFDWSGKIAAVKFKNVPLTIAETTESINDAVFGKGFYNEFGIDTALGYEEAAKGGWFHKIGVGLLQKDDDEYVFTKKYEIKPAQFKITASPEKMLIRCTSETVNGYAYVLKKEIAIQESGFTINYQLENTGEKDIRTTEYVHNFMAINKSLIGSDYVLKFPFEFKPDRFWDTVNSEKQVVLGPNEIGFKGTPNEQFFFSNLSGGELVDASWELQNHKHKIGISETGSFKAEKVNLWGWKHVISPELFNPIFIRPGEATEWSRIFKIYHLSDM